jgi:ABC-type proline/glycine betaine transport system permease subunit
LQNFFHWYILQSLKLKRPQIQLRPHHFWTNTSKLTTVVNSVLKFMINGITSILKSLIFQICAAIYQLLLHVYISQLIRYARASSNYSDFLKRHLYMRTGYWTRAIKRFALFDLLKSLYSDTKILSKNILSLQRR